MMACSSNQPWQLKQLLEGKYKEEENKQPKKQPHEKNQNAHLFERA